MRAAPQQSVERLLQAIGTDGSHDVSNIVKESEADLVVTNLMGLLSQRMSCSMHLMELASITTDWRLQGTLQEFLIACLEVIGEQAFAGIANGFIVQFEHARESGEAHGSCTVSRVRGTPRKHGRASPALMASITHPFPVLQTHSPQELQNVEAEHVDCKLNLHPVLLDYVPSEVPDATEARRTLTAIADVLANGVGGVIVAVIDGQLWNTVRFHHLDDGHLTHCFQSVAKNLHEQRTTFLRLLEAFTLHGTSDRWQHGELETLVEDLPQAAERLAKLEGNPKDGAMVVSFKGNIMGAAGHLKYASERFQLLKSNGKHAGTRHASSLAFAEWLGNEGHLGVVFVRSDDGGVHAFVPCGEHMPPRVLHFDSLKPLSQEEMLQHFRERIKEHGKLMRKTRPGLIRQGKRGERVLTVVNGRVISDIQIEDDTCMVVRAPTVDQELYVLTRDKFLLNWAVPGQEIDDSSWEGRKLKERGFRSYWPKPGICKWIYEICAADVALVPTGCFVSSWGAQQPLNPGDFLAMPTDGSEIYLMPVDVLSCFSVSTGGDAEGRPTLAGADKPYSSQQEMLDLFRPRIVERGQLMHKVRPALIRPGRLGERVVTCVQGRVISDVVIKDETSVVVRGSAFHELYTLTREKFEANWIVKGEEIEGSSPKSRLLRSQGFRQHWPSPGIRRQFYEIAAEDLELVPRQAFLASWGAPQPLQEGDFLAVPAPAELASEIYLMPRAMICCYAPCEADESPAPEAPAGLEPPPHRTQQEMLELFRPRILERGRLMRKVKPALIRPGRRGECIATCVGGRVISEVVITDETSMVIRAPTVDRELYVLSRGKFEENWVTPGEELTYCSPVKRLLSSQGFKKYRPRPGTLRYVYQITASDLELVPSGFFVSSWGVLQPVQEEDFLAMPAPALQATELYLMHCHTLVCYEECQDGEAPAVPARSGSPGPGPKREAKEGRARPAA